MGGGLQGWVVSGLQGLGRVPLVEAERNRKQVVVGEMVVGMSVESLKQGSGLGKYQTNLLERQCCLILRLMKNGCEVPGLWKLLMWILLGLF